MTSEGIDARLLFAYPPQKCDYSQDHIFTTFCCGSEQRILEERARGALTQRCSGELSSGSGKSCTSSLWNGVCHWDGAHVRDCFYTDTRGLLRPPPLSMLQGVWVVLQAPFGGSSVNPLQAIQSEREREPALVTSFASMREATGSDQTAVNPKEL